MSVRIFGHFEQFSTFSARRALCSAHPCTPDAWTNGPYMTWVLCILVPMVHIPRGRSGATFVKVLAQSECGQFCHLGICGPNWDGHHAKWHGDLQEPSAWESTLDSGWIAYGMADPISKPAWRYTIGSTPEFWLNGGAQRKKKKRKKERSSERQRRKPRDTKGGGGSHHQEAANGKAGHTKEARAHGEAGSGRPTKQTKHSAKAQGIQGRKPEKAGVNGGAQKKKQKRKKGTERRQQQRDTKGGGANAREQPTARQHQISESTRRAKNRVANKTNNTQHQGSGHPGPETKEHKRQRGRKEDNNGRKKKAKGGGEGKQRTKTATPAWSGPSQGKR